MSGLINSFQNINDGGTLTLLFILLLLSLIIGWWAGRKVTSAETFLYSPGEMRAFEFGLSETAYMIAVGTTLILLSSLTFQYGSFFILVVVVSWSVSLLVYAKLALEGDLITFFRRKGAHLGDYVVGDSEEKLWSEKILLVLISVVISLTFWFYFITEILALKVLMQKYNPNVDIPSIIAGTLILVILYTTIGGYKGTFRTDIIQTLFFVLVLIFIVILGFIRVKSFSLAPFMKRSLGDSIIILVSYTIIGVAALITGLDIWARMRASEGENKEQGKKGLKWSFIAVIPFILVCFFGLVFSSVGQNQDPNSIVPVVTGVIGIPLGFMFVFLITLTISTADTSLITCSQAMAPIFPHKFRTINGFRFFIIIMSILGLIVALAIPISRTIQAILLTISFPVALTPVILIRRFSKKKKVKPKTSIATIILSSLFGLGVGIYDIEYADYSAAIILLSALILYFIFSFFEKDHIPDKNKVEVEYE